MTAKRLLLILTVIVILLCIGTVNATTVTMEVDSKHIIGSGLGNVPFDLESCINVVYVISEMKEDTCGNSYVLQEYPVSIQDYCRINTGQTVTLEVSDSRLDVCKVVKIE
jgi:hypothetical protein